MITTGTGRPFGLTRKLSWLWPAIALRAPTELHRECRPDRLDQIAPTVASQSI